MLMQFDLQSDQIWQHNLLTEWKVFMVSSVVVRDMRSKENPSKVLYAPTEALLVRPAMLSIS